MKTFASSLVLLLLALGLGAYLWHEHQNPPLPPGSVVLLRTDPQRVSRVDIMAGKDTLTLQRNALQGGWQVQSGVRRAPADPDRLGALLQSLQLVQAPASGDLTRIADYGLTSPRVTLALTTEVGRTLLEFGNLSPIARDQIYARVQNQVGVVSTAPLQYALADFDEWRDRAVLRFNPDKVTGFSVQGPWLNIALRLVPAREGTSGIAAWQIVTPLAARADANNANTFLSALSSARFASNEKIALSSANLPAAQVRVQTTSGEHTLNLFRSAQGRSSSQWSAQNSAGSRFVLSPALLALLKHPLYDWREKNVSPLRLSEVNRFGITYRGVSRTWQREGSSWVAEGDEAPVSLATRDALLDTLLALQNVRVVRFQALSERYKAAGAMLVLQLNDQVVRIGRESGGGWTTSSGLPDVAQIAPADLSALQAAVARLLPASDSAAEARSNLSKPSRAVPQ